MKKVKTIRCSQELTISSLTSLSSAISEWISATRGTEVRLSNLQGIEARTQALRRSIETGTIPDLSSQDDYADAIYSVVRSWASQIVSSPELAYSEASALWEVLRVSTWEDDALEERDSLLCSCAFAAWRAARLLSRTEDAQRWEVVYLTRFRASLAFEVAADVLNADATTLDEIIRSGPEDVFQAAVYLRDQTERAPAAVAASAQNLYRALAAQIDRIPPDLRAFSLAHVARIAGAANRIIGMFDEAHRCLDLAEAHLAEDCDPRGEIQRVKYQRLSLLYMLGGNQAVIENAPQVDSELTKLQMNEDRVKCRILWAAALKYAGEPEKALRILEPFGPSAAELRPSLYAWVLMELGDAYLISGNFESGIESLAKAERLMRDTQQVTGWAITVATLGFGYRTHGNFEEALELFRAAQAELMTLDAKNLGAYVRLLSAETYLAMGEWNAAEKESREILSIFQRYGMVSEGIAALTVLREAVRRRALDPASFRDFRQRLWLGLK